MKKINKLIFVFITLIGIISTSLFFIKKEKRTNTFIVQAGENTLSSNLTINPELSQLQIPTISLPIDIKITPSVNIDTKLLIDLLTILLNLGKNTIPATDLPGVSDNPDMVDTLTPSPATGITSQPQPLSTEIPAKPNGALVYYQQRDGIYDNYPLPSGCTIRQAGCGPTTVAMIVASYADRSVNPITIVELYKQKKYYLGCEGSRYTNAKSILASYGLKTTDYLTYNKATINQVADDFRNYIKSGWTIFALADFRDNGGGHFFWITDVSANNDTWAYDPYYGRFQPPPYNEKSRYPFPKYRIAFGVKR